ncbi:MAG: protein phosphatase 2C domain-containing protein [Synergistaceae bacterium]|nr:protein phosphatase 2C domain-containing protein [Synergistaceae bacterium]
MNDETQWRIATAFVTGTSHKRLSIPCQDYAIAKIFQDVDGYDVLLVVVSDGAGSALKAEIGSSIACCTVAEAVEVYLAKRGQVEDINIDVARSWLRSVQTAIKTQAKEDGGVVRDYACTLLIAVIGQNTAATMQVGDGAIVVSYGENWSLAHWPQRGEFANTTFFTIDDCAESQLEFKSHKRRIIELAAFSDGIESLVIQYATQAVFEPFFDKMFPPVRSVKGEGVNDKLSDALAAYLSSPSICERNDDDKTLVLATRRKEITVEKYNESTPRSGSINE